MPARRRDGPLKASQQYFPHIHLKPLTGRLGPRPLPFHLMMEGLVLQMCFAGLTPLSAGSPLSRLIAEAIESETGQAVAGMTWTDVIPAAPFVDALTRQGQDRMTRFARGIAAYQHHPFRRTGKSAPRWTETSAAPVRDYGGAEGSLPVLVVPSLINKSDVLDLYEDRSFMRYLSAQGLHPYLLDWTAPDAAPPGATLDHYITSMLMPALRDLRAKHGRPAALAGYCMGGTLTAAPAVLEPDLVSSLVLLAAPWDFHADNEGLRHWLQVARPGLEVVIDTWGEAPVDLLQALFAGLDPTLAGRKFRKFADMDQNSDAAKRFVALEDWLNDGVPLAGPVAKTCLLDWYLDNDPMAGKWEVDGTAIDPSAIACPTLAVIPSRDRIVPPASASALAARIGHAAVRSVALGHIGMITGGRAEKEVYEPVAEWIKNAATQ
jgi:polyhydroxyalkanoate synthase